MSGRLSQSTQRRFDLLVIGGGIHGLFAAFEAARRGWAVALVERDDFGSGLSFNHQRTVHGGLRALQSGRLDKTLQQIAERRAWAIMAPHLVRPLPFLLPTRGDLRRSRTVVGTGLRLYDWLGRRRNAGLPESLHLPDSHIEGVDTVTRLFPGIDGRDLTGGAIWYDYQVRHPDRLNWLVAAAAERAGATLFNHTEATTILHAGDRATGAQVRDVLSGDAVDLTATTTLLCAGGAIADVHAAFGLAGAPPLLRASNILVDRPALDLALAAPDASGRMLTATPWSGRWLIGTFQSTATVETVDAWPTRDELDAMIEDANVAFPTLRLSRRDVLLVHNGLTPAVQRHGHVALMPDHVVIDHSRHGRAGIFTLVGVKFTTARLAAGDALHRMGLAGRVGSSLNATDLEPVLLPSGSGEQALAAVQAAVVECDARIDDDIAVHLADWYGTEAADVLRTSATAGLLHRLAPGVTVIGGEILYAIEHAHARRLADAVLRRTRLGTAGHPGTAALEAAADIMGARLGWSAETRAEEIARVERRYRLA